MKKHSTLKIILFVAALILQNIPAAFAAGATTSPPVSMVTAPVVRPPLPEIIPTNSWQSIGPGGGAIIALTIDPLNNANMYAGGDGGGIFISRDGGNIWRSARTQPTNLFITKLLIDPITPTRLYAGTMNGIFLSVDSGETWRPAAGQPPIPYVRDLILNQRFPNNLFVVTWSGGFFTSSDFGNTWSVMSRPATRAGVGISALAIFPSSGASQYTLVVGTSGQGIFYNYDGRSSWSASRSQPSNLYITSLSVDPTSTDNAWASTNGGGIFLTTSKGLEWASVGSIPRNPFLDFVAVDPHDPTRLYASAPDSFFMSEDAGGSWIELGPIGSLRKVGCMAFNTRDNTFFVGTAEGLFFSDESGSVWTKPQVPPPNLSISAFAVNPQTPAKRVAGTSKGIFYSNRSVTRFQHAGVNSSMRSIAMDPMATQNVYMGTENGFIYTSRDGGISWAITMYPDGGSAVNAIVVDPISSNNVYATIGRSIYASNNSGATWAPLSYAITPSNIQALAIDPVTPSRMYVGAEAQGVFISTDAGRHWTASSLRLGDPNIKSLAIDPTNPAHLYAGTPSGILISNDSGANWTMSSAPSILNTTSLAINPQRPTHVYAGTMDGLFFSEDSGAHWNLFTSQPPLPRITTLTLSPFYSPIIHVGTATNSAYFYQDPTCGDRRINGEEACDDGNRINGDGCDESCAIEPGFSGTGGAGEDDETSDGSGGISEGSGGLGGSSGSGGGDQDPLTEETHEEPATEKGGCSLIRNFY